MWRAANNCPSLVKLYRTIQDHAQIQTTFTAQGGHPFARTMLVEWLVSKVGGRAFNASKSRSNRGEPKLKKAKNHLGVQLGLTWAVPDPRAPPLAVGFDPCALRVPVTGETPIFCQNI